MSKRRTVAVTGSDIVLLTESVGTEWSADITLAGSGAQCVAVDPQNPDRIAVGTFDQGLFLSSDGGSNWRGVENGIPHGRVLSVAYAPSRSANGLSAIYAGTEPSSLYRSEDDGSTWEDLASLRDLPSAPTWSFPPRPWTSHVRWITSHPTDGDTIYAGIELGGVMVSRDGGVSWEDRKESSYHDCHRLATHPTKPERVYEAAGGGVSRSEDAGRTWEEIDIGRNRHYVWALAVDPADPDLWYVSAAHGSGNAHRNGGSANAALCRKRDSSPWEQINGESSGLPEPLPYMIYALLTDPESPNYVLAGFQHGEIWESNDQGDSWTKLPVELDSLLAMA